MIDLHCHILPGIDDGAPDLPTSLEMARQFVADGVEGVACTPHILPGLYPNRGPDIRTRVAWLQDEIAAAGIPLWLTTGADVHLAPNLPSGLASGEVLSLGDSRYVLIEPPHHVAPVRFEETMFGLLVAGYVPIITHPERLSWLPGRYAIAKTLVERGVWMQITSGSLIGKFGRAAQYWGERMLADQLVHVLASDAHDPVRRCPDLAEGRRRAARYVGTEEATRLVVDRPSAILANAAPGSVPAPIAAGDAPYPGGERGGRPSTAGEGNVVSSGGGGFIDSVRGIARRLRGYG